jgi:hypothetical protein
VLASPAAASRKLRRQFRDFRLQAQSAAPSAAKASQIKPRVCFVCVAARAPPSKRSGARALGVICLLDNETGGQSQRLCESAPLPSPSDAARASIACSWTRESRDMKAAAAGAGTWASACQPIAEQKADTEAVSSASCADERDMRRKMRGADCSNRSSRAVVEGLSRFVPQQQTRGGQLAFALGRKACSRFKHWNQNSVLKVPLYNPKIPLRKVKRSGAAAA